MIQKSCKEEQKSFTRGGLNDLFPISARFSSGKHIIKVHLYIKKKRLMKDSIKTTLLLLSLVLTCMPAWAQRHIVNGVAWFDTDGNIINSHGSGIIHDRGRYWLFGEYKSDSSNAFPGFGCYSSEDLVNWRFERIVLPVQKDGLMGPNRVGERVKVMRCPTTGKYENLKARYGMPPSEYMER